MIPVKFDPFPYFQFHICVASTAFFGLITVDLFYLDSNFVSKVVVHKQKRGRGLQRKMLLLKVVLITEELGNFKVLRNR